MFTVYTFPSLCDLFSLIVYELYYIFPVVHCQDAVRAICNEVEALVKKCGKPKMLDAIKLPPPELYQHVEVYSLLSFIIFCY